MDPFRTPSEPPEVSGDAPTPDRACLVCGALLGERRRSEARCCSGRCRIQLSRGRRLADLTSRLAAAETALAHAAEAVGSLKELTAGGVSRVAP